jgi:hypothetical protein
MKVNEIQHLPLLHPQHTALRHVRSLLTSNLSAFLLIQLIGYTTVSSDSASILGCPIETSQPQKNNAPPLDTVTRLSATPRTPIRVSSERYKLMLHEFNLRS